MKNFTAAVALSVAGMAAAPAFAAELPGRTFVGLGWGESTANYHTSGRAQASMPAAHFDRVIRDTDTWSLRAGQEMDHGRAYIGYGYASDSYHGVRLRQESLSASYDHYLPLAPQTRLFGGATVGVNYLSQVSTGYTSDRDWGAHAGLQAGLLQDLNDRVQFELGYRYSRHTHSDVDFRANGSGAKTGTARLKSVDQAYLGLNYRF